MRTVLVTGVLVVASLQGATLQQPRVVRVAAERFAFTPSRIELTSGEPIELVIPSEDTAHGFRLRGSSIDVEIPKRGRGEMRVPLTLEEPGRYAFECSRMCGAGHAFMRGEIVVRAASSGDGR
jgi:cytochrome c oxidase subunit 2